MPRYYELEVLLRDAKPRIWRRFLIADNASFLDLHEAIQDACGWTDTHLFAFHDRGGEPIAGLPDDEYGEPDPDAKKVKLRSYFDGEEGTSCVYEYDFGDSWEHDVKLVRTAELPEKFARKLLGGARAFPPEDCGGIPGYEECVRMSYQCCERLDGIFICYLWRVG
jgi:pRiA4b ORF-3-like protein